MHDKSQFHGIDPETTRTASRQMEATADNLKGLVGSISKMLDGVVWEGADARRAVDDWNGALRPELEAVTDNMRENSIELERRARLQEEASA